MNPGDDELPATPAAPISVDREALVSKELPGPGANANTTFSLARQQTTGAETEKQFARDEPPSTLPPRSENMRGIWSDSTLHDRLSPGGVITDSHGQNSYHRCQLDPAGYRLAMGSEVYISPGAASDRTSVRILADREAFIIPPGQFAFLTTEEVVHVPQDAFCFISLRSKRTKFRGLVNVSGFHADPGYDGKLVFAVFNAGPGDVHLRRGDELFAVMFADLDRPSTRPRPKNGGFDGISTELIAPIAGELQSLAGLKTNIDDIEGRLVERLNSMEREVVVLRWAVALIVSACVTLLVKALIGR